MQITGGMIAYEDGIKKPEEYAPPKKARAELKFDIAEGEDADVAMEVVLEKAMGLVGRALSGKTDKDKLAEAVAAKAAAAKGPEVVERKGPGPQTNKKAAAPKAEKPKEPASAAAVVEEDFSATPAAEDAKTDPAAMEEFDAAPEPVSDAELTSACSKKNAEIKSPQKIRDLVGTYNPDKGKAFQVAQIPQEHRRDFLTKLAALTA